MSVEIVRLGEGDVQVELLPEVGARLHRLRVFGHDLLRTPSAPERHAEDPFFWGAFVMAPWCNRISAGPEAIGSRQVAVASNFPDGSAIHGQVYARPWVQAGIGSYTVAGGGDGWPWEYGVRMDLSVADASLSLVLTVTNRSNAPMPAGVGLHPWFLRPVQVAINADAVYASNVESRPQPEPVSGPHDLRDLGDLGPEIDATWTQLREPPIRLAWPHARVAATILTHGTGAYVCAAGGGMVGAIAVEPQTHAPQGIRRLRNGEPGGLLPIAPGASLTLAMELGFTRS